MPYRRYRLLAWCTLEEPGPLSVQMLDLLRPGGGFGWVTARILSLHIVGRGDKARTLVVAFTSAFHVIPPCQNKIGCTAHGIESVAPASRRHDARAGRCPLASHHTKDKGDLGLGMVISDLMCHGIGVFIPLSEHQPMDLIAVDEHGRISRVQVKYRTLEPTGVVTVSFRNTYSDSHGAHTTFADRSQFDCYAIYCPENSKVYYLRNDEIPEGNRTAVALRVLPAANNQRKKVIWASDYEEFDRIFE